MIKLYIFTSFQLFVLSHFFCACVSPQKRPPPLEGFRSIMSKATKAAVCCALAGSAAAFSGLAPSSLKPSAGKLTNQRLQLRQARPIKVFSLCFLARIAAVTAAHAEMRARTPNAGGTATKAMRQCVREEQST